MIPLPDSYTVRLVDMPVSDGGMVSEDPDGHVNVYLNARLSTAGQFRAAKHEYEHWLNDDLNNSDDIQTVERRAGHKDKTRRLLATLKRASDIPSPKRNEQPPVENYKLNKRQAKALIRCLNNLDKAYMEDTIN